MRILRPFRLDSWWEHKLSPILATAYATAAASQIALASVWPAAVLALLALIVCATYVSVLNDLTDARDDQATGKPDRWQGKPRTYPALILAACLAAGGGFLFAWRSDPLLFSAYLFSWLAFGLYSLPPIRLKTRGTWGVLADACGANLFPTLVAVLLVYRWHGTGVSGAWILIVALWALATGVRGILWHQMGDAANDGKIGLRTFVVRHGMKAAERLGLLALLVECAAFAVMISLTRSGLAWLFLLLYGIFALVRRRLLGVRVGALKPVQGSRMALSEYYIALYPLAYLLAASWRQPAVLLLLVGHAILFSGGGLYMAREAAVMLRMRRVVQFSRLR